MRKFVLISAIIFCLLLTGSVAALAESGLRLGLGYEDLTNELTLSSPDGKLEVNSSCPMLFVEAGYDFGTAFAIDAKYGKCVEDQTLVALDSSILGVEAANDTDTDVFSIEASLKKQLGSFSLKGIIGYLESDFDRNLSGRLLSNSGAIDLERSVSGGYLGGEVSYAPNDQFAIGAAYRWMVDPDLELQVAGSELDVSDPYSSQLEVFLQTALTEKVSLKAGYSVSWVEYDLSEVNVENITEGLSLKLQYRF